jgi:integrase
MRQHPKYSSLDHGWLKVLLDGLPAEPESEKKRRKANKYLEYEALESIAGEIHAGRNLAVKKGPWYLALQVRNELLMKWLPILPWRQRNVRECRIGGPNPNLFRSKIPPFSDIDKPEWVIEDERKNPDAEFWQFRFNYEETKTGIDVHAILPRPLIGPLEEYLRDFRHRMLRGPDPGLLFVNQAGRPMTEDQVTVAVGDLTQQYAGKRVTPHPFRDIVAFTWLKHHPKDYLTLSKLLWHADVKTTINEYGSRFNESCGVSAMDAWLQERGAKSK